MTYLRHPALAVWAALALALAALIALACHLGGGPSPTSGPLASAPAVPPTASAAATDVQTLRTLMGSGTAAGVDLPALHAFGQRSQSVADAAVAARHGEGAAGGDALLTTLTRAAADAHAVATAGDVTAATSARSALGLDVDTASALVAGLPMPTGGAAAARTPLATAVGGPTVQAPAAPSLPALPAVPARTVPTLPTPGSH